MNKEVTIEILKRLNSNHDIYLYDNITGEKIILSGNIKKLIKMYYEEACNNG